MAPWDTFKMLDTLCLLEKLRFWSKQRDESESFNLIIDQVIRL